MIWNGGVPLGFDANGAPLAYHGDTPTLIFGPPGSFKTVGVIATQLLDDESKRSYVVIDPKGEVCAITSKFRRRVSDAKIINPYQLLVAERPDMKSDGWNPLGDLVVFPYTRDFRVTDTVCQTIESASRARVGIGSKNHLAW